MVFGIGLKQFQKGGCLHDLNILVLFQCKQAPVPADKVGCLAENGAFQEDVVVGISADNFQHSGRRYDARKGADLIRDFRRLAGAEVSLEPKLFPPFLENGFTSQAQPFALAGCLDTVMRISQPTHSGKEDVGVENNAGNLIHDSWKTSSIRASRCDSDRASQSKWQAAAS
jgi:hypothetical protein